MGRSATPIKGIRQFGTHIDIYHQMIHEGKVFKASHIFEAVDDDAYGVMLIRNGKNEVHVTPIAGAGGKAFVSLLEDVEVSAFGTAVTIRNMNRKTVSEMAAGENEGTWVRAYHTPTLSDNGDEIDKAEIFGASQTVAKVGGASVKLGAEWIIPPGSLYVVQVQNKSGGAVDIEIRVAIYEYKEQ